MPSSPDDPNHIDHVLLARLAVPVTAAHPPDPDCPWRCANLRCRGQVYPCPPARAARRARHLAGVDALQPDRLDPPVVADRAVGRATVTCAPDAAAAGYWAPTPAHDPDPSGWLGDRYRGRHRPPRHSPAGPVEDRWAALQKAA
ncbi:hypothetical protein Lfu02_77150 [Longispora fulva]|uniref:Uncharacterized protein n=2 Tax=Longispora fulva TaxID=619741 RepID=A0A8J7GED6_9ACTN|nr:hypothetical protein [Longispora fulva]GIG63343.1 hypothetical protein Lfu02_77150 [Longispora fulva]